MVLLSDRVLCGPLVQKLLVVYLGFLTEIRATSHLTISMRVQRETGKIQRNNYHHGNCGTSLNSKTSSVSHRNVKNS